METISILHQVTEESRSAMELNILLKVDGGFVHIVVVVVLVVEGDIAVVVVIANA